MVDPIAALRASHERLRAAVAPLSPGQMGGRAYPTEWSIAQVLSHLGSGAQINGLIVEAGVAGTEQPDRSAYQEIWNLWNAKSPEAQAADCLAADAALVARVEALAGSTARFQVWFGEADIAALAAARLFEHAVHTWDVVVGLDPGATLSPDAVQLVVDGLDRLVGFAAKPAGRTGLLRVTTTDPGRDLALELADKSTLSPWAGGTATAQVRLPAEAFVRLVYGRLDHDHTPAEIDTEGITLDDLRAVFPGF